MSEAASWQELDTSQRANESAGARCVGLSLETRPDEVDTNMVFFNCDRSGLSAPELKERMAQQGVLMHDESPTRLRLVTHLDVTREQILAAIEAFRRVVLSV